MDEAGATTIATTVGGVYRELRDKLREEVGGMDDGTLNWKPLPLANSVAVLIVHALGSEREMIRAVRSLPTERDRDSEFRAEAEAAGLLALLDEVDRELEEHLGAGTGADPTELRPRGERRPRPGLEWLLSNSRPA